MKTKCIIGRFRLGWRWVEVRIDTSSRDGMARFIPDDPEPQITIIEIGTASPHYSMSVATLFHEAFETVASDLELRFAPCGSIGSSAEQCVFMFTHAQFSEITDRVGYFMSSVLPEFHKAWLKTKRKRAKR